MGCSRFRVVTRTRCTVPEGDVAVLVRAGESRIAGISRRRSHANCWISLRCRPTAISRIRRHPKRISLVTTRLGAPNHAPDLLRASHFHTRSDLFLIISAGRPGDQNRLLQLRTWKVPHHRAEQRCQAVGGCEAVHLRHNGCARILQRIPRSAPSPLAQAALQFGGFSND